MTTIQRFAPVQRQNVKCDRLSQTNPKSNPRFGCCCGGLETAAIGAIGGIFLIPHLFAFCVGIPAVVVALAGITRLGKWAKGYLAATGMLGKKAQDNIANKSPANA
jgi:hypothetical protein